MVSWIIKQFSGKVAAGICSLVLIGIMHGLAYLASKNPSIAATIDPQAVAGTIDSVILAGLNILANDYLQKNKPVAETIEAVEEGIKANAPAKQ